MFPGALLVRAYYAEFKVSIPSFSVQMGQVATVETGFNIEFNPDTYYGYSYVEGEAPYRIMRFPKWEYDAQLGDFTERPSLCPYIGFIKTDLSEAFESSLPPAPLQDINLEARGKLDAPVDMIDGWKVVVVSPCFEGECPEGYEPQLYGNPLPQSEKGKTFSCDVMVNSQEDQPWYLIQNILPDFVKRAFAWMPVNTIEISATFTGEAAIPPPACTENCNSNVMFLPGIMGSRLFEKSSECGILNGEKERWVSSFDCDHKRLELDEIGNSVNSLYTKEGEDGVVDDAYSFNLYQSLMNDLEDWKANGIIVDYALIPYDWRLSIEDILLNGASSTNSVVSFDTNQGFKDSYIYKKLREMANSSRNGKVTIIAHSNGGLVAKALILKLMETNDPLYEKIENLVLVAVPQLGTPDALTSALHGTSSNFPIKTERSRDLLRNMPFVYHLLPSFSYLNDGESIVDFSGNATLGSWNQRYQNKIDTYSELRDYVLGEDGRARPAYRELDKPATLLSGLFDAADRLHRGIDDMEYPDTMNVYEIAGWGIYTPAGLRYERDLACVESIFVTTSSTYGQPNVPECKAYQEKLKIKDVLSINGDGTVMQKSAHGGVVNERIKRLWVDLNKYSEEKLINRIHRDILEVNELREYILSIVQALNYSGEYIVDEQAALSAPGEMVRYEVHSPLDIHIYDTNDNHFGKTDSTNAVENAVEKGIRGVQYREVGDSKVVLVPAQMPHRVELRAYASGSFTFDVERILGDSILASTTFSGIPVSTTTRAKFEFPSSMDILQTKLDIDFDGDKINDVSISATRDGTSVYDITPPDIILSFDPVVWEVKVTARDTARQKEWDIEVNDLSIYAKDDSGNTTSLMLIRHKEKKDKITLWFDEIIRNGETLVLPRTRMEMVSERDKRGNLRGTRQRIIIRGEERIMAEYSTASNSTTIIEKTKGGQTKKQLPGMIILKANISSAGVDVVY
jgi:pimeloyl-ACP methyl ester carboxylesterase